MKELIAEYAYDDGDLWAKAYRSTEGRLFTVKEEYFFTHYSGELTTDSLLDTYERRAIIKLIALLEEDGDNERAQWLRDNCLMPEEHRIWALIEFPHNGYYYAYEVLTKQGKLTELIMDDWSSGFSREEFVKVRLALAQVFPEADKLLAENHYEEKKEDITILERTIDIDGFLIKVNIHIPVELFIPEDD